MCFVTGVLPCPQFCGSLMPLHASLQVPHLPMSPSTHKQEVHGGELPPAEGCDSANPDWIEAGRWLERQRDLYRRQKLLLLRVRLMKELLGEGPGRGDDLGQAHRS